jgi:light-regulated signal transduction histidine kinase (bacteriophytochrome)
MAVDLTATVRWVGAALQQDDPERKVELVVAEGISVDGDPRLLQRVLENLLNNAYKFTAKRVAARIEFGTAPQGDGRVAYFVPDNGIGFDMAYADQLFGAVLAWRRWSASSTVTEARSGRRARRTRAPRFISRSSRSIVQL